MTLLSCKKDMKNEIMSSSYQSCAGSDKNYSTLRTKFKELKVCLSIAVVTALRYDMAYFVLETDFMLLAKSNEFCRKKNV